MVHKNMPYRHITLPTKLKIEDLQRAAQDYEAIAVVMMRAIVQRYQRTPDYPFIDTKLDLITGRDFDDGDSIRGKEAIYGWIQGRGLESLAGHARFFAQRSAGADLVPALEVMLREILAQLRKMRQRNGGHLSFFMHPNGQPFRLDTDGHPESFALTAKDPFGFSDLFAAKGMFAAADYLGDDDARAESLAYIDAVEQAIWGQHFHSDQVSLDPKNHPEPKNDYYAHGHYMIHIGTAAIMASAGIESAVERGLRLIEHELKTYVNLDGRIADLEEGDFWEGVDADGMPYRESSGVLLSDPGHSLEFVGLALKFIAACQQNDLATSEQIRRLQAVREHMPTILERNFKNGYIPEPRGISKAFDLASRTHLNTDMPWWNLPETIRAAALCLLSVEDAAQKALCLRILRDCHNAFREFTRPDLHLMAYQTRNISGQPVDAIPATADADPGYHTGLSLIDAIAVVESL
ncbi:MAG: mannose/cellobiose epimerase-like protein (N-acyl-D-glucosamine 2-epimerase family) [Candidatus Latescibacterota bacterium]|jgi:mannose/cellobiose epimerase-like protein (N-acyl-D-glucosamine 2-epimerase family)